MRLILLLISFVILSACQTAGRYDQKHDSKPEFDYGDLDLSPAVARYEPYREANFKPYTVLGQFYTPMLDGKGFEEFGEASWYGQKFHGHTTSSGEVYNMFLMTAAHKTLPLPSYVKVTNLDNQKHTIVRVNDRGPFHQGRIIDLSYAAAKKLDVLQHGVAKVKIEVVHVSETGVKTVGTGPSVKPTTPIMVAAVPPLVAPLEKVDELSTTDIAIRALSDTKLPIQQRYIQVAAVSDEGKAKELKNTLSQMYQTKARADYFDNLYRVRLGPIKSEQKASSLIQSLKENGFENTFRVWLSPE